MFCTKCGKLLGESQLICENCGHENKSRNLEVQPAAANQTLREEKIPRRNSNVAIMVIYFILALVVLIIFMVAANRISEGGLGIMEIRSVGGQTLEEAYYFELGNIYSGYAILTRALGIFFASVLVWLGLRGK